MGLGKFILKHGVGSPGKTAENIAESYNFVASKNLNSSSKEILLILITMQIKWAMNLPLEVQKNSLYSAISPDKIIQYSNGDLALYTFILMFIETENFREGISLNEVFIDTIEVIYETIQGIAPSSIKLTPQELMEKANAIKFGRVNIFH